MISSRPPSGNIVITPRKLVSQPSTIVVPSTPPVTQRPQTSRIRPSSKTTDGAATAAAAGAVLAPSSSAAHPRPVNSATYASAAGCLCSPRAVMSAGRRLSIADKAFGGGVALAAAGGSTSPRHPAGRCVDNPLDQLVMPNITRVSSAASSSSPRGGSGNSKRPLSGRRLAKTDPSPANEITQNDPSSMFPAVALRAHPPPVKSIVEESIIRSRQPSAGQRPPFGRSSYARAGLPNPKEREQQLVEQHLMEYQHRLGIPTFDEQIENHFTKFEPVFRGELADELASFESRLAVLQKKRAEEEAERQAEEQDRLHKQQLQAQQHNPQRRSTIKSPIPVKSGFVFNGGGGANQVLRRQSAYTASPLGPDAMMGLHRSNSQNGTPEPSLASLAPSANREHHLTKLMFRRLLLNQNALVDWIMNEIGEGEAVRRLNVVNDRYGVRRINQEDFYFLMQEVMAVPRLEVSHHNRPHGTSKRFAGSMLDESVLEKSSRAESHFESTTDKSSQEPPPVREPGGNELKQQQECHASAPLRDDLQSPVTVDGRTAVPTTTSSSWKRPYTLQRSDADLLFTACDWRLIGVVEDCEVVDSIRLLFRPAAQVIASHCKRVLEGRCSVSQMTSMHEAGTMLQAVADVARPRYGALIDKDVAMVMRMLEDVMTSGYVPLVCFRNFTVHGVVLSRALNEMNVNAELPTAQLSVPSPDPDRDIAAVAQQLQQQSSAPPPAPSSSSPPSPKSMTRGGGAQELFRSFDLQQQQQQQQQTLTSKGPAVVVASPRNTEHRDLTHPRFRADQSLLSAKVSTQIAEHDGPQWYSSGGIVWMKNSLHGPLAMT